MNVNYITGNPHKVETGSVYLEEFDVTLVQKKVPGIIEPQSDSIEEIALSKASQAYNVLRQPVLVNDSGWSIPSLKGFPGPYMAFVNEWFTADDFLNLMKSYYNRKITLTEFVVYQDINGFKVFSHSHTGRILMESKGEGRPSDTLVTFRDDDLTIAECSAKEIKSIDSLGLWREFGEWIATKS